MLNLLRWFVGCWHEWDVWEAYTINGYAGQRRRCRKCGVEKLRKIYAP